MICRPETSVALLIRMPRSDFYQTEAMSGKRASTREL